MVKKTVYFCENCNDLDEKKIIWPFSYNIYSFRKQDHKVYSKMNLFFCFYFLKSKAILDYLSTKRFRFAYHLLIHITYVSEVIWDVIGSIQRPKSATVRLYS